MKVESRSAARSGPDAGESFEYGIAPTGYRLPAGARVGAVVLQISDLERSVAFYRDVLGLKVLEESPGRAILGVSPDGPSLVELREKGGATPVPRGGRLGLYHFAILLPDRGAVGRFLGHLSRKGVRAGAADHLVSEAVYVNDPDGLGIEVYADRPRSEWRHADRQLAMATEPLDLQDLAHAAGDEPWTVAPRGTTIGHVHLHVGELGVAEAFYHVGLGLDKVVWSYPGALFLSAGGYHHHLGVNSWAAGAAPAGEGDARLLEWELVLPEVGALRGAAESLRAAGFVPEGGETDVLIRDPWGTALRIRHER